MDIGASRYEAQPYEDLFIPPAPVEYRGVTMAFLKESRTTESPGPPKPDRPLAPDVV